MASTLSRTRIVTISVLDRAGEYAFGAQLRFAMNGTSIGSVTIGGGAVQVEIPDHEVVLQIQATFGSEIMSVQLGPADTRHTFRFESESRPAFRGVGTARCPDGTIGQPCVDCVINGMQIRICA